MITRVQLLAVAFWLLSCSYSYSDVVAGSTNNAAANGFVWNMEDVLPPQAGLQIGGVFYRYTVEKDIGADMQVHIQNENALGDGYIFRETDNWDQLPGGITINKVVGLENIPYEYFGTGSIQIDGEGNVVNPSVNYAYRFDPCYIILLNPECPGYDQSLYDWLKSQGFLDNAPDIDDPFYDEWVQMMINREAEVEDEEVDNKLRQEDENEEDDPIEALNANVDIEGFIDGARQSDMIAKLSTIPQFENYITAIIPGGVYEETITLQDATLPDNNRALNNLSRDEIHRDMIRSQYKTQ